MPSKKLRPCPFCGEAKDVSVESLQPSWWIHCASCGGAGPMRELGALAEKAWNRRAGNTINDQIGCLADIRRVVGDPEAKLMQSELVECIALLVADAALGRAVRKIPDMAKLWHADDSQTWYLHPGDAPCLPLGTGSTPEAALRAAGLMKGEEK